MARKTHPEDGVETPPKRISPEVRAAARSRREPPPPPEERYWSSIPLGASEDAARFPEEHGEVAD
jgi:hypothetical protein